jgi:hypothetical protein
LESGSHCVRLECRCGRVVCLSPIL